MPSGEGTAYTMGGWRAFIIQAGYLGAALFGAILIVVGKNPNWSRLIMIFLGVLLLIAAIFYGVPTIFSTQIQIGLLTTLSSILFGGLLLWASTHVTDLWVLFSINLIAFQLSFNVFIDVFVLVIVATRIRYMPANDALSMARLTGLPPLFWAILWTLLTFLVLGGALWVAWTRE